jgi:hypothetical protein
MISINGSPVIAARMATAIVFSVRAGGEDGEDGEDKEDVEVKEVFVI